MYGVFTWRWHAVATEGIFGEHGCVEMRSSTRRTRLQFLSPPVFLNLAFFGEIWPRLLFRDGVSFEVRTKDAIIIIGRQRPL